MWSNVCFDGHYGFGMKSLLEGLYLGMKEDSVN